MQLALVAGIVWCMHPDTAGQSIVPHLGTFAVGALWFYTLLQVREYMEKHYAELSGKDCIKLAIKSMMESVEAGSKNIEVSE